MKRYTQSEINAMSMDQRLAIARSLCDSAARWVIFSLVCSALVAVVAVILLNQ